MLHGRLRRMAHRLLPFIRLVLLLLLLVLLLLILLLLLVVLLLRLRLVLLTWGTFGSRATEEIEDAFHHVEKPHNCR